MTPSRRDFLRMAAALGMGRALGAGLPPPAAAAPGGDYKALVCIFLYGGNDSANMVLATDADSWARYQAARGAGAAPIALAPAGTAPTPGAVETQGAAALGGVLPIAPRTPQGGRTFALNPLLPGLQGLFNQGRLAVVANVGTLIQPVTRQQVLTGSVPLPRSLFSHNDQQSMWQTGSAEGATRGWGGLVGDRVVAMNPNGVFTAVSLFENVPFLAGDTVRGYQSSFQGAVPIVGAQGSTLFGSAAGPGLLKNLITKQGVSPFESAYASVVSRSIGSFGTLDAALKGVAAPMDPPLLTDPVTGKAGLNALALNLQAVARLIAAGRTLGMRRQIFFVGMAGFDLHQMANASHPALMAGLDAGLVYFQTILGNLGGVDMTSSVTAFTLSEFSRCFISNGKGTDHGWGGHHLVVGGAVKGGDIYGTYPTVGMDQGAFVNPDALPGTGAWIPSLSVDQYAATLGGWMGLDAQQLLAIFPHLVNFPAGGTAGLGFL